MQFSNCSLIFWSKRRQFVSFEPVLQLLDTVSEWRPLVLALSSLAWSSLTGEVNSPAVKPIWEPTFQHLFQFTCPITGPIFRHSKTPTLARRALQVRMLCTRHDMNIKMNINMSACTCTCTCICTCTCTCACACVHVMGSQRPVPSSQHLGTSFRRSGKLSVQKRSKSCGKDILTKDNKSLLPHARPRPLCHPKRATRRLHREAASTSPDATAPWTTKHLKACRSTSASRFARRA